MSTPRPATVVPSPVRRTLASRLRSLTGAGALLAAATIAACSDAPMAPAAAAPGEAPAHALASTLKLTLASVLQRSVPLTADSTAKVIGPAGGTFSLPRAGLTVTVPAGAVSVPTRFTVTAPAGRGVWYEFGPSGSRFAKPLTVTQDLGPLGVLSAPLLSKLEVGYFVDGTTDDATGTAVVQEWLPVRFDLLRTRASFQVTHFSGYMVSTGRSGELDDQ